MSAITLDVSTLETIKAIKGKIEDNNNKEGVPVDQQRLTFGA